MTRQDNLGPDGLAQPKRGFDWVKLQLGLSRMVAVGFNTVIICMIAAGVYFFCLEMVKWIYEG